MHKRPLAILLGITGDLGFAAGCLLQSLVRHCPGLKADIVLYTDGTLPLEDQEILSDLGAKLTPYIPPEADLNPEALRQFSNLCLARFEGFKLLSEYKTVLWLDVDTAIQGDISDLLTYGPLALALEDPYFTEKGVTSPVSINAVSTLPCLDPQAANLNSGVLVLQDSLPEPYTLYQQCLSWLQTHAAELKYPDQAVLNMLAQDVRRRNPNLFSLIPHDCFNAHPRNPGAQHAALVHAFGAYKFWDDGLTLCSFPEWHRDYKRWLDKGGSPWRGNVGNTEFLEGGSFFMLKRLYDTASAAQDLLERQQSALTCERLLRQKLEKLLLELSEPGSAYAGK